MANNTNLTDVYAYRVKNPLEYIKKNKRKITFFKNLTNEHLDDLIYGIKFVKYKADEVIFKEGDEGPKRISYLVAGDVVFTKKLESKEVVIAQSREGSLFGEMRHITGEKRNTTATAGKNGATTIEFLIKVPSKENQVAFMYYYKNISKILIDKITSMNKRVVE